MKHTLGSFLLTAFSLFSGAVLAAGQPSEAAPQPAPEPVPLQVLQNKAEQIVKKCVAKAMLIREERVCESKKSAITACLVEEVKNKDLEKAQQVCERNYIL
jgi:hypothetical protein